MSLVLILARTAVGGTIRLEKLRPCHALFAHFSRRDHAARRTNPVAAGREAIIGHAGTDSAVAHTHEGLLAVTGMVAILVLPVVAVATIGHQPAHAQEDDPSALGANRLGRRCLRRCYDGAARRYCCLHGLFSCLWPKATCSRRDERVYLAGAKARPNRVGLHQATRLLSALPWKLFTMWYFRLGDPSKRYYSIV